jgi:hypothetical protein
MAVATSSRRSSSFLATLGILVLVVLTLGSSVPVGA